MDPTTAALEKEHEAVSICSDKVHIKSFIKIFTKQQRYRQVQVERIFRPQIRCSAIDAYFKG